MDRRIKGLISVCALLSILACNITFPETPEVDPPGLALTLAVQTLEALRSSQTSTSTITIAPTPEIASPTIPLTQTPVPTENAPAHLPTQTSTATAVPSLTPLSTSTPTVETVTQTDIAQITPGGAGTSYPCYSAQFIEDITIPDGYKIPVGLAFTKVWRIKNIGSCTWDSTYHVTFISGDRMSGSSTQLEKSVKPGDTIDIAINLVAPSTNGLYKGNWMLQKDQIMFGGGSGGTRPFFVQIEATPNTRNVFYNFALSFCTARWESSVGDRLCPGNTKDLNGFQFMLHKAILETRRENEPTLWMQPSNLKDGWISGTFPAIEIQPNAHFQADIGCLGGYEKCNVNFELWYRLPNNPKKKIGTWQEYHDNHLTRLNIDLSPLAGKRVTFILIVIANNNPQQAAAFWLMPQIRIP